VQPKPEQVKPEPTTVSLRGARDGDVDALFAHQADPEGAAMADFPSRDREAFLAHLAGIRADPEVRYRVIEADGVVVGNIGSFDAHGGREVGYWIDRAHWGRGIATRALRLLLAEEPLRPLQAGVVPHNIASRRVLAKAGFLPDGVADDGYLLFRLDH
jgi:RimJ/RimL family protein N-acetyltransferase